MNKLTMEQKSVVLKLCHLEFQFEKLMKEERYQNSPAWLVSERWISEVLGVDFRKDIYDNEEVKDKNREISRFMLNKFGEWFVGDALSMVFVKFYMENHHSERDIVDLENKWKEIWTVFNEKTSKTRRIIYVDSGVVFNGEKLYREVVQE
jgi:hypothetical protein